jgi:hypothetical protein
MDEKTTASAKLFIIINFSMHGDTKQSPITLEIQFFFNDSSSPFRAQAFYSIP